MTLLVFIWMSMAVIPVLRLLLLVRLRVFVRTLVVFRQELTPGVIFVVIPVVIILVRAIVNALVTMLVIPAILFLPVFILTRGSCHDRRRDAESCPQKNKT